VGHASLTSLHAALATDAPAWSPIGMLLQEIEALDPSLLASLRARGLDEERLVSWARQVGIDREARNRLSGTVEPPRPDDVVDAPLAFGPEHARLWALGEAAIARGEVALCVLAGGMATRMGGVVKALVEALPGSTFLRLRLGENATLSKRSNKPFPLWLMTSQATDAPLREALGERLDGQTIATFEQLVSLRLTPEGDLFRDARGEPSVYPTGHGDLPDALRRSGLLHRFVEGGGKIVCIANVDNLGATVDAAMIGAHLEYGGPLTVELVDKLPGDRGGGPVRWNGRPVIAEEMRLPTGFDPATVPVFNTNTFIVDARALEKLGMNFTYVEVEKKVDGRRAVQFERLLGEITVGLSARFVRVPREGIHSRFLPVKDTAELERRQPEIEAIAKLRGML